MEKIIVITGGAGFIGSCMVRTLNDAEVQNIIVVDNISSTPKWMNLRNKQYLEYVHKSVFLKRLRDDLYSDISHIIHLGACSSTAETDFDYLWNNNVNYTKTLWKYCCHKQIPFIYASSAATYGDGSRGFDDMSDINLLSPLNGYGYSKQAFDQWAIKQTLCPPQHVGLKFFNVYGPNEYFKSSMASMVYHGFMQAKREGEIRLFRSYNPKYADGGQLRDFVYVKDVCKVISFFLKHPEISGIFNVGTGQARSFTQLAEAVFHSLQQKAKIKYIDMPDQLRDKYQYYTKAETQKLQNAGYSENFFDLTKGVEDYVCNFLTADCHIY